VWRKKTKIGHDSFVISDVFVDSVITTATSIVSGVPDGVVEERLAESTLKVAQVLEL
jgi:hypothetical protein